MEVKCKDAVDVGEPARQWRDRLSHEASHKGEAGQSWNIKKSKRVLMEKCFLRFLSDPCAHGSPPMSVRLSTFG